MTEPALLPFVPNWRDGYRVSYRYRTEIFTSRSGREQRRALMATPRKRVGFTITQADVVELNRFVLNHHGQEIALADAGRHVDLVAKSGNTATVATIPAWIAVGADIVLGGERRTVTAVSGTIVTLDSPAPVTALPGDPVYPCVVGRLSDSTNIRSVTDRVGEMTAELALTPGGNIPDDRGDPYDVFNGREVFLFEPNWATPLQGSFETVSDVVDFGRGVIETYKPVAFGARLRQAQFLFPTQRTRDQAVAFFCRMRGQLGEFYLPAWDDRLRVAAPPAAGSITIRVIGHYSAATTHRAVLIRAPGGERFYRRITDVEIDGTDTVLTTDIPWPSAVDELIWLQAARFATDEIEVECVTDQVARLQFAFRTIEDLQVAAIEDPWADLDDGARWLVDTFGWQFASGAIVNPIHQWVHVDYPLIGDPDLFTSGATWLNHWYGQPYWIEELATPLHTLIHTTLPEI